MNAKIVLKEDIALDALNQKPEVIFMSEKSNDLKEIYSLKWKDDWHNKQS